MKKQLLLTGLFLGSLFSVNAQVLQSENFNALTVGNVGADLTGATSGQGGWYVVSTNGTAPTTATNANASNFQIVSTGQSSNGLKIQTTNGDKGSRFMLKTGLDTSWAFRTVGNNIIQLEFDFFTGPASASTTQNGISIYGLDGATLRTLAGFAYVPSTKVLYGVGYLKNGAVYGNYLIGLGVSPAQIVLADNTWYTIGVAYNTANGAITWKGPGFNNVSINAANYAGPFEPTEVRFTSLTPATNTTFAEHTFDNFTVTATPTVSLLATNDFTASKFSVYPNPVSDIVKISNDANLAINEITVTDLNGRTVKSVKLNGEIATELNIADLASGVYMLNISSEGVSATKKIVKN